MFMLDLGGRWRASAYTILIWNTPVAPCLAAEAPSFGVMLQQSLSTAPTLLEQAANVSAAGGDARQAHAWPNPTFSATFENIGAPLNAGTNERQETYSLTQPFEIGGKRGARIAAGERQLTAAQARERQAQVAYAANLAIAYATAEAMQQRKAIAAEELARAGDDLRAARALVQAGKEADLRAVQAAASVATAQAGAQQAEADATEAMERLSALAGVKETYTAIGSSLLARADPFRPTSEPDSDQAPAVAVAAAQRDALASQALFEEKKWIPDIGFTAGTRSFGWTNQNALVLGVTVAIPLFDRNSGAIDAARQRTVAAEARLEAAKLEATANRRSAQAQVTAAEKRLEAAGQGEAAALEAYRLGRIGYEAGKTSLLELLSIRRALAEARSLTVDSRLARVRALTALSVAAGRIAFGGTQ